jgi:hypothetical protein
VHGVDRRRRARLTGSRPRTSVTSSRRLRVRAAGVARGRRGRGAGLERPPPSRSRRHAHHAIEDRSWGRDGGTAGGPPGPRDGVRRSLRSSGLLDGIRCQELRVGRGLSVLRAPGGPVGLDEKRHVLVVDHTRSPRSCHADEERSARGRGPRPARRNPRQWCWPRRPRVCTGVAPGRVHCGTGRLVGPQVAFPSASERQYQQIGAPCPPTGASV